MATIKLECPACGSADGLFRVSQPVKSYNDLIGARCASRGHNVTDEDIKAHAIKIAREQIAEMIRRTTG